MTERNGTEQVAVASREPVEVPHCRMEPLATLPVFMRLDGRRVVVAGGTAAAAWKAELVAAAGAHVAVYAAAPCEEMRELLSRGASSGRLTHHERPWDAEALTGAALAVCDAASVGEARAFACAARAGGVPYNVIDRPAECSLQFGAVVNRSPVVVGVSTDGAAPILAQAVRRRIETLLPQSLSVWAERAREVRDHVLARLAPGHQRRAFWERFCAAAFANGPGPGPVEDWLEATEREPSGLGRVALVGAGPGDAGLLTLEAVRALQASDVILFDDLVSDDVLRLARREARRIAVGKRGARQSCRQEDITELMLKLARAGRNVVRLKAGDPAVFGRAGEEIAALRAEGIAVRIVPGVTSASAMAAQLTVSLTHRDHAQVVSFMTGHSREGRLPDSLAVGTLMGPGRTAIVYMGVRTCREWVAQALADGIDPTTPAVAVASITRPDERRWCGPIAALPEAVGRLGDGPILIGVGATFGDAAAAEAAKSALGFEVAGADLSAASKPSPNGADQDQDALGTR